MDEVCRQHGEDIFALKKDLYNDGQGIKYKMSVLWDTYNKNIGKRDVLLTANSIILLINGALLVLTHMGLL
jgi:archaellum component FlaG (FlaF/FlaG flagellin family)